MNDCALVMCVGDDNNYLEVSSFFFFQAEDGIRDLVRSRGLVDVYKRQLFDKGILNSVGAILRKFFHFAARNRALHRTIRMPCLLYTSDAADDLLCVDLGGRRIIKKNNTI